MRLLLSARIGLIRLRHGKISPARLAKNGTALLLALGVSIATGSPAHADITYAPAPKLPPLSKSTLQTRFELTRQALEKAAATAEKGGDGMRAHTLQEMADPTRDFLDFDPQGDGRAVEVVGDLATAKRIAIVIPGAGNTLTNFDSVKGPGGGSHAVYQEAEMLGGGSQLAVIGWLGYDPPAADSIHVTTEGHADAGAHDLETFLTQLKQVTDAPVSLLCHSYGSVVCGAAAKDVSVTDIAVFGSPGMGVGSVSDLDTSARVWAGRGATDGISNVPYVRVDLLGVDLGFGDDPTDPAFGARIFDAGQGGHSDYLRLGDPALKNLTLIALGRTGQVQLKSAS